MDRALCTLDGIIYQAADFRLVEGFDDKRRNLICPECGMRAYYRSYARNAREAHFGARPHADGCTLAAPEQEGTTTGLGADEAEILTTGRRIIVDFNYGAPAGGAVEQHTFAPVAAGSGAVIGAVGEVVRDRITRRLGPILRALMESEEFRASTQPVEIPGIGEFTVANLFRSFGDVTEENVGSFHGFWGMVPAPRQDASGSLWLNSGGQEDMSVLLDQSYLEEVRQRFNFVDIEDLAGAFVLVLGELRRGPTGKKYVLASDPSRITLRLTP